MFKNLSRQFTEALKQLRGQSILSQENMRPAVAAIREALIDADVALPVINTLLERVQRDAMGQAVVGSLKPDQVFSQCVHQAVVSVLGGDEPDAMAFKLSGPGPQVVLLAGLQGAGKTTTTAKLGRLLAGQGRRVMVVSVDVYRPAAIEQLALLAKQEGLLCVTGKGQPHEIARQALKEAQSQKVDVLLVDTAGRLHVDEAMMAEVKQLHEVLRPVETLFVVDGMTGQDAAHTARAFAEALPLTGVILTKTDGDTRGGAALSVKEITGRPIKFVGEGEKTTDLKPFDPRRVADQILDMGDLLSLVEDVQRHVSEEEAKRTASKMQSGDLDLNDFMIYLDQLQRMGGAKRMMEKLPGMNQLPDAVMGQVDESKFRRWQVMLSSMTAYERAHPDCLQSSSAELSGRSFGKKRRKKVPKGRESVSRLQRIARGSGVSEQDVKSLLTEFGQLKKMMKMIRGHGLGQLMSRLGGGFPSKLFPS